MTVYASKYQCALRNRDSVLNYILSVITMYTIYLLIIYLIVFMVKILNSFAWDLKFELPNIVMVPKSNWNMIYYSTSKLNTQQSVNTATAVFTHKKKRKERYGTGLFFYPQYMTIRRHNKGAAVDELEHVLDGKYITS